LLVRLRDDEDNLAWSQFVEIYAPLVYQYVRRRGVQDADAADVTQETLKTCSQNLGRFKYDPARGTFRAWLFTVVRTRMSNYLSSQRRHPKGRGGSEVNHRLEQHVDKSEDDMHEWTNEYELRLLDWAKDRIRNEFRSQTWKAFDMTAIEGLPAKEVAAKLGMTPGAVYVAKTRVLQRLKACIQQIDDLSRW
jgi:RNA polymerase sigma-70 factor (ECF subfamily)